MNQHAKDITVECPAKECRAKRGEECKGTERNIVHIGRRIRWLLRHYPDCDRNGCQGCRR